MIRDVVLSLYAFIYSFAIIIKLRLFKYLGILLLLLFLFSSPVILFDFFVRFITDLIPYAAAQEYALTSVSFSAGISGFFLLLVLSPVFSILSEETGKRLTGKEYHFSISQLVKDILRGIKITLRNLFYQYIIIVIISILLYFFSDILIVQITGNILIFLISSYFLGFSILDYAMENLRMTYKQSVDFVRAHPGLAIGLGSIYYFVINWNDWKIFHTSSDRLSLYWPIFSESLVAFFGVIAASYLMYQYQKEKKFIKLNFLLLHIIFPIVF